MIVGIASEALHHSSGRIEAVTDPASCATVAGLIRMEDPGTALESASRPVSVAGRADAVLARLRP